MNGLDILERLNRIGAIDNEQLEYWKSHDFLYATDLVTKAISWMDARIDNGVPDYQFAVKTLADAGVINTPEYWLVTGKKDDNVVKLVIGLSNKCPIILYKIVEAEAGDQDEKGIVLVTNTIQNRMKSKEFPNTIYGVVFQKGQFEPVATGTYDKAKPAKRTIAAVNLALAGKDYSQGAEYFRMIKGAEGGWHERALKPLFDWGDHRFYTEKNG